MRVIRRSRRAARRAPAATLCAGALVGMCILTGHAWQLRTVTAVTEGVYTGEQATRGQQIYQFLSLLPGAMRIRLQLIRQWAEACKCSRRRSRPKSPVKSRHTE